MPYVMCGNISVLYNMVFMHRGNTYFNLFKTPDEDAFVEKMGVLSSIMEDIEVTCVSIMGDWNADISDGDSVFGTQLRVFCEENNVILSTTVVSNFCLVTHLPI